MSMKLPQNNKEWAKEAMDALQMAMKMSENPPEGQSNDIFYVLSLAPTLAGLKRGIRDKKTIKEAYEHAFERFVPQLKESVAASTFDQSQGFLTCYFNALVHFGLISEAKAARILSYTIAHYHLNEPSQYH